MGRLDRPSQCEIDYKVASIRQTNWSEGQNKWVNLSKYGGAIEGPVHFAGALSAAQPTKSHRETGV